MRRGVCPAVDLGQQPSAIPLVNLSLLLPQLLARLPMIMRDDDVLLHCVRGWVSAVNMKHVDSCSSEAGR